MKIPSIPLAPYFAAGAVLTLITSHVLSRRAQRMMESNPYEKHQGVPLDLEPGWEACSVRNGVGYLSLELGGIAFSVAILAARAGLINF